MLRRLEQRKVLTPMTASAGSIVQSCRQAEGEFLLSCGMFVASSHVASSHALTLGTTGKFQLRRQHWREVLHNLFSSIELNIDLALKQKLSFMNLESLLGSLLGSFGVLGRLWGAIWIQTSKNNKQI